MRVRTAAPPSSFTSSGATFTLSMGNGSGIYSAAVSLGGSGGSYTPANGTSTFTVPGGTLLNGSSVATSLTVTSSNGIVTNVALANAGQYSARPAHP